MTISNIKKIEHDFERGKTMKCPECNKVVSISECSWVEGNLTILRTLRDINNENSKKIMNIRMSKNGTIQKMHKFIGYMLNIMTDEQREKAKKINKAMKDEIKMWEKLKK
ncbi:hypothetical protein KAI04_04085 [Candidatus Pacearchaeota archaeon]|nr:hypothetical protein [Candidatus Pacearchaeota archaeon]